ncbi:MAG: amidophosphoribosyltransferase [Paramuribaculum sp.]|nr:amidophosphoribosyltransferase [Paramuribaculum sp.]
MEVLKHECGIVMLRLRKPLAFYKEKYGSYAYGLSKLYLMMEKQHNRGQEAAGIGVVKLHSEPGHEYVYRERALGSGAISEIFNEGVLPKLTACGLEQMSPDEVEREAPFIGEIYMGHLRYSTTGKSGLSYVHPFLRRNNWPSRNLLLCGNFNMTNTDEIFRRIVDRGQHPRIYADTVMLLEQLGYALDKENQRLYRQFRFALPEPALTHMIEERLDLARVLESEAPGWDGGYVICGATGSGDMFVLRDPHGIRPAFYYADDEIIAVASERPAIQTVLDVSLDKITELRPGAAVIVQPDATMDVKQILPEAGNERCSFERIYFSRGSDADIYQERKALGRNLTGAIINALPEHDLDKAVFSFIPNTAEVAFVGMVEGLTRELDREKMSAITAMAENSSLTPETLEKIMKRKIRVEKVAIKDIKLRTFISEGTTRNDLAAHVYDVTYGCLTAGEDTLVVIDDSIVRGTTLRQSILRILDRLSPKKIIVVSSAPQVRYPDYYGIDMSRMGEFIAFRAAMSLLNKKGLGNIPEQTYQECLKELEKPAAEQKNCVKAIYAPFSDDEISAEIAAILTPADTRAEVQIIYQTLEGLHMAVPDHPGNWYFSGNYPTPGGVKQVNRAYVNYYEGHIDAR